MLSYRSRYRSLTRSRSEYVKDREFKAMINRCDLCNDRIMCSDNIEAQIDKLDEIDNTYESEYDKHEPRLLLCRFCQKEYLISAYPI